MFCHPLPWSLHWQVVACSDIVRPKHEIHFDLCFGRLRFFPLRAGEIYVSSSGDDTSPGTREEPVATLERACDLVRLIRRERPAEPVTVWIGPGDYLQGRPLVLGPEDSGTAAAPVVWRALKGAQPRLLGARRLLASDFSPVTDPATRARLARGAEDKIVEVDVDKLGLTRLGPYPDVFDDNGGGYFRFSPPTSACPSPATRTAVS